jgi:hypothetical protein
MQKRIEVLKRFNRPIFCTEYMARPFGSTFEDILPIFKENNIGGYNWGFVAGKSQTHCPWDSWQTQYENEPELWFHDIFRSNGEAYDEQEVAFLRSFIKEPRSIKQKEVA